MSDTGLEARDLGWTPLGAARPVLSGVDLRVEPGERVLLAGASGAGKSTLLRALAGVLGEAEPGDLTGRVTIDGSDIRPGDGRVGLLLQDPTSSLVAGTVGRDVAFGPENLGVPRSEIHARVERALAAVGFPYGTGHRTSALSGGETQRLALAGVLAMRPRMLLLDEPTAMLDDASAAEVRAAVARVVADRRVGLVVVEHRLDRWLDAAPRMGERAAEAAAWGGVHRSGDPESSPARAIDPLIDRLVVLGPEGIVADGPPEAVLTRHGDTLTDLGLWVPGTPPPAPQPVSIPAIARPTGGAVLALDGVALVRRPRPGLSVARRESLPPALVDIDLALAGAAMTVFRGRSGAGKSSLLGVLAGLERPTSGRVTASPELADGLTGGPADWRSRDLAARISWVPQQASLTILGQTVLDGLLATSRALGLDEATARAAAEDLAEQLHLGDTLHRNPHTLSGGQMRRLALASALVHGPSALALDEPSVGQDRHTWAAVAGVCRSAVDAGAAVAVSTHDDDLAAFAHTTHHIDAGRLGGVR